MTNQVKLKGNLYRDAEVKTDKNGKEYVLLYMAASNDYRDDRKGEWVKRDPTWALIPVFKPAAVAACKNAKKGQYTEILAGLRSGEYTDKETGEVRYSLSVVVQDLYHTVRFPAKKGGAQEQEAA